MNNSSNYDSLKSGSGSSRSSSTFTAPDLTRLNPVPSTGASTNHTDIFISQQPGNNDPKVSPSFTFSIQHEQQIRNDYFIRGKVDVSTSGDYSAKIGVGKKF